MCDAHTDNTARSNNVDVMVRRILMHCLVLGGDGDCWSVMESESREQLSWWIGWTALVRVLRENAFLRSWLLTSCVREERRGLKIGVSPCRVGKRLTSSLLWWPGLWAIPRRLDRRILVFSVEGISSQWPDDVRGTGKEISKRKEGKVRRSVRRRESVSWCVTTRGWRTAITGSSFTQTVAGKTRGDSRLKSHSLGDRVDCSHQLPMFLRERMFWRTLQRRYFEDRYLSFPNFGNLCPKNKLLVFSYVNFLLDDGEEALPSLFSLNFVNKSSWRWINVSSCLKQESLTIYHWNRSGMTWKQMDDELPKRSRCDKRSSELKKIDIVSTTQQQLINCRIFWGTIGCTIT